MGKAMTLRVWPFALRLYVESSLRNGTWGAMGGLWCVGFRVQCGPLHTSGGASWP